MPPAGPITALPPGYREAYHLRVAEIRLWLPLLVVTIVAAVFSVMLAFGPLLLYHAAGAPLVFVAVPEHLVRPVGVLLLLGILPLHEWVHGQIIRRCGHRPRYGVKWYALFTTADNAYFRRDDYVRVLLAPLWVISLLGMALLWWVPLEAARWIALAVVANASGAGGDLWMAWEVRRFGPEALIRDEEDGMRVFLPENTLHSP